ncbi:hypothetical protein INT43_004758 [Umbelopsis isabellina]|uniref:Uncharacterized protein n=1 Tax=Mortierella isabellina TaxID=91625 RepID=A0A8H7PE25_MORIS|nr:hypothetical protein INT43_004758 [Umbelopsis isabellina]
MVEEEAQYQAIRHNNRIWRIPIRNINNTNVVLFSDIQSFIPSATGVVSNDKLIPFVIDASTGAQLIPKRIEVTYAGTNIWDILYSEVNDQETSVRIALLESKYEDLINRLDRILPGNTGHQPPYPLFHSRTQVDEDGTDSSGSFESPTTGLRHDSVDIQSNDNDELSVESENNACEIVSYSMDSCDDLRHNPIANLAVAAESVEHTTTITNNNQDAMVPGSGDPDEPPSYENSILGNIRTLTEKLLEFESHIANRHKSPRWLAERNEWLHRTPGNIEQFAFQLVELEMALLWTAVAETWLNERETWLNLVMNARSLRHLAGALVSLERHTLVLDETWSSIRERWINELLEMVVLPFSHP